MQHRKSYPKLTEEQKHKALYYLKHLNNNSDKEIAKLVNGSYGQICNFLRKEGDKMLERVSNKES